MSTNHFNSNLGKSPSGDVQQLYHHSTPPNSAPPSSSQRVPERPNIPLRASTTGSTPDPDPSSLTLSIPYARSDDLNHLSSSYSRDGNTTGSVLDSSTPSLSSSSTFPTTPSNSDNPNNKLSPKKVNRRKSSSSLSSIGTSSDLSPARPPMSSTSTSSMNINSLICSACGKPMQGAFVRALSTAYHLSCFNCMDCSEQVAAKFFPIEGPDGKQYPLCEKDYFRRLNLICAKCDTALRASYITAANKKYHVEHFTCSVCPTLFGPQDSYYEHDGDVFCHFHYSTRYATKCAGCNSAILKQFVEINRNMRDECWHPECYMINKFWNVKVMTRRPPSTPNSEGDSPVFEEELRETPASLKEKQARMEQQVYRIWTVLSAFEESSAACISDMLRQVSSGQYLDAIRMAEKFILHVEVLFATIDDIEWHFGRLGLKGIAHVREARMLCRKTVDLFTMLSRTQETGVQRMGMTQDLLSLVTGLAHYLKILIRIALTGALKLEREQDAPEAMTSFLDKLHLLAVQGGNPAAQRLLKGSNGEVLSFSGSGYLGTQGVTYGFRSLAPENAGESPFYNNGSGSSSLTGTRFTANHPPSDLCATCAQTVEEDCVRLGTYRRWHSHCLQCNVCGKVAAPPPAPKGEDKEKRSAEKDKDKVEKSDGPKISTTRRPPANVAIFVYDPDSKKDTERPDNAPTVILCTDHAYHGCRAGFEAASRLEQYAFLLNVALRRLYLLLRKQGMVPLSPASSPTAAQQTQKGGESDLYRNSGDIMRMKQVHLGRKLSETARLPKRSTVVESPAGKSVQESVLLPLRQNQDPASKLLARSRSPPPGTQNQPPIPRPQQTRSPDSGSQATQVIRPPFARNNTEVMIVDDASPTVGAGGQDDQQSQEQTKSTLRDEDAITLADIPHIVEAVQAREEHRSLPRESSIPYIAELSALELAIVKHAAVLALHRSPLKDHFDLDEVLELIEVKKSGFFQKLFKSGNDKRLKKKGVFGVPLELLVEREGADSLLGATRSTLGVPSFIDDVICAMRQMDMSVEGIFRKNGNIRRLKDLTEAIDRDPSSVDLTLDNPVQLAALLKRFLRDLPDPLMTFKLHKLFIASQSASPHESERMRLLHMVTVLLPKAHRDTMEVLFVFLKWVASFAHMDEETGSKMDLSNLATVICPSILYARGRDAVRDDSFGAIRVVTALLEHQDEFFQVPGEFLPILNDQAYFSNSMELPSKDFMKKCDTYMRLKANGRAPPMTSPSNSGQFGSTAAVPNHFRAAQPPPINAQVVRQGMSPSNSPFSPRSNGNEPSTPRPAVAVLSPPQRPPRPSEELSPQLLMVQNGPGSR